MEIFFTKEKQWLEKWDEFVSSNEYASHLVLSDWLQSYKSYGFDFEIGLCLENEKIVGGFGAVIARIFSFKFYVVPSRPLFLTDNKIFSNLIEAIVIRAKETKMTYCQIVLPVTTETNFENEYSGFLKKKHFEKGTKFKYVFSFTGLNWLALKDYKTTEEILLSFKSSVRRDIRSAERKGVVIKYASSLNEIESAYQLCVENARKANYAIRDWNDFKETILNLIAQGRAKFIVGIKDDEMKGAIFLIKAAGYYNYILGGTKKEKPDLLIGHLLQWEAIKLSALENCEGYNISLGGSKGVLEFKNGFNTKEIKTDSNYYIILNPGLFKLYLFLDKYMKPYKSKIAKVLAFIKKK